MFIIFDGCVTKDTICFTEHGKNTFVFFSGQKSFFIVFLSRADQMLQCVQVAMETCVTESKATLEINFSIFRFMKSIHAFIVSRTG